MKPTSKKIAAALAAFSVIAMTIAGILDGEPAPVAPAELTPSTEPTPSTECECECATPATAPDLTTQPQTGTEV